MQQLSFSIMFALVMSMRALVLTLPLNLALGLWERYLPCRGERPSLEAQLKGLVFQIANFAAGTVVVMTIYPFIPQLRPMWPALWLPAALLLSDCLQYWEHRLEHHPLLWRFHAVHHSTREMASTSNAHHFLHQVLMVVIYGLPMAAICGDPMVSLWVTVPIYWWAAVIHSPAKINIGPLRMILVDNRAHRIHHSLDQPQHFDKNFGAILNVWDRLFGTFYRPAVDEWPSTGVREYGELQSPLGSLAQPFLPKRPSGEWVAER